MNAPAHTPRHPMQDRLYWVLSDYRASRRLGLTISAGWHRRRALELIAQIKGKTQ